MITVTKQKVLGAPTPMAGLALGIGSLGWCWENAADLGGRGQLIGAGIASVLLVVLLFKFLIHPRALWQDISHPVVGSVVPTFAMGTMVVSKALYLLPNRRAGAMASGRCTAPYFLGAVHLSPCKGF